MAFSFVQSATYDSAGSTSAVITKPSGTADNDILFALLKHGTDEATSSSPSGWTLLRDIFESGGGARWTLWWKLAASEGADYTWTWATSSRTAGLMVAYRDGFDTADPIDTSSSTAYTTNNTTLRAAAMSVAAANSPLIFFGCVHASSANAIAPPTVPATMTEDVEFFGGGGGRMNAQVASVVWSGAGSTGDMDATLTSATATKHAFAVALNPPAGDTTAPVLTAPVATATAATTATVGATTDEANGTLYSVITTSSTQPSVAQIKAGQNHLGASATWSSNQAISSTGAKTFSVTGLTAGTMYFTYTVHADAAGNNSNVVASGFAAYDVSAASVTPVTQSVALNATGSFVYTLNVTPVSVTPVANVVALTLATPISTAAVTPVTQNIVLAVTLPVTRAQALPLTQSVALNFSGVVAYTLNVTPASPTISMQDVALNPSYPSAGGTGATTGRRNRRYSYALKYFSRG